MLTLVGLGIWDEKDISLKGLEELKNADRVYAELYTNIWRGSIDNLEKLAGKKIIVLERKEVEESFDLILEKSKKESVCLLVSGDPLAATTHSDLILQARRADIETRIVHASSVFTAVAECGLQLYKFGKTATIPLPEKTGNVLPESLYDTIKENLSLGLHTLLLLDIDIENNKNLSVKEALQVMEKLDKENILKGHKLVVMSKLGSDKQETAYGKTAELVKTSFELPAVIIVPGKLHFTEEEMLGMLV